MSRKRAAVGFLPPRDSNAKHASLMQDYSQLQDEFVALKDRVQSAKIKRTSLLAEVRFLRRKLKDFKETPPTPKQNETTSSIQLSTAYTGKEAPRVVGPEPSALFSKNSLLVSTKISAVSEPLIASGSDYSAQYKPFNDKIGLVSALKTSVFGNRPNVFVTAMPEKRKISWQDQISLECK